MSISEIEIRQWADRHECRRNLPILVRRLIRETTPFLTSMRFPGNEAVDLSGLDGQATNSTATMWVPEGPSFWEMGCNQDPRVKADGDYLKRTGSTPLEERAATSFVFVTPRRWNQKNDWLAVRRNEGSWASVHAYDAIDLETWIEEAPVTSSWLREKLGGCLTDIKTPDEWWHEWATASAPPITMKMVSTRRYNEKDVLLSRLRDGEQVVSVKADDRGEAVAFVVATLIESESIDLLDRTLVATSGNARIPPTKNRLIVVTDVAEGDEPHFGDRRNITIVRAYPKGRMDVHDAVLLSHVPSEAFRSELEGMGLTRDEAESMASKTGHSVPVLRRHLSNDPEVRRPPWARDHASAKRLLPFALAGSWLGNKGKDDVAIIQLIGDLSEDDIARTCDDILTLDDSPIARYGHVHVVVSQLDALFAVGPYIERSDLDRFFQLIPELFGDRDPALDLPQDQWWMADVLGHGRNYSGALLSGLGDALCILSAYGAEICGDRLGINLAHRCNEIVRALMLNATEERWLTIRGHLRVLAEAAPSVFLDCLDEELGRPEPAIRAIMGTTGGIASGECLRTNLLWALELLAWHPTYFARVAEIVFNLRRIETNDNFTNSPKSTARSLFLAWPPATALSLNDRMLVLRNLATRHRRATIDVCISLLPGGGPRFASRTARPQWRSLGANVLTPTNADVRDAAIEASRLLVDLAPYSTAEIECVVDAATRLHPDDLDHLVLEVERWAGSASDDDKAPLRQNLRQHEVMQAYREDGHDGKLDAAIRQITEALTPSGPLARHRWLFDDAHVEWRALIEDENEEKITWEERNALVQKCRYEAIQEIHDILGKGAIFPFALSVKHPDLVAQVLAPPNASAEAAIDWAKTALQEAPNVASDTFLRQVLWSASTDNLRAVTTALSAEGFLNRDKDRQRLAENLPGRREGWEVAEALGDDIASAFWKSASIQFWGDSPLCEVKYGIQKLLAFQRPRSAFLAVQYHPEFLPAQQWLDILSAIARGEEPEGPFPDGYNLDRAFQRLDEATDVSDEQIASLELPFVRLLGHHGGRTLAVHRQLSQDPNLFVEMLCWIFRRRDGAPDPEQEEQSLERRQALAELAFHAFEEWDNVPGSNVDGEIDCDKFNAWVEAALSRATDVDRKEVAESYLGALLGRLARRRAWADWLPTCILDFLNRPEHGSLRGKFCLGVHNARGMTSRSPYDGGAQERRLAGHYHELAVRYGNSHPRVSSMLVSIAEDYERDARREDEEAAVGERWNF